MRRLGCTELAYLLGEIHTSFGEGVEGLNEVALAGAKTDLKITASA